MPTFTQHRYRGPLPNITTMYPAELALPSDAQWLRDNPEAVARIRVFRDDTRRERRALLFAVRLHQPGGHDGFQVGYVEAHPAHLTSDALSAWQDAPTILNANQLALSVLAADAEADGGHALTALQFLVLPDLSEIPDLWRGHFHPSPDTPTDTPPPQDWQKATYGPEYKRNTAHAYGIAFRFPPEQHEGFDPDADPEWLRKNPDRVGRVRVLKNAGGRDKVLLLTVRIADAEAPDGWTVGRHIADAANLGEGRGRWAHPALTAWRAKPTPANEDAAILDILWRDAKRVGGAVEMLFRLLVLPAGYDQTPAATGQGNPPVAVPAE
jgi:hypothetical protein